MSRELSGVMRGNTVVLSESLDVPDGQEVEVFMEHLPNGQIKLKVTVIEQQPELNAGPRSSPEQVRQSLGLIKESR